MPIYDYHCDHCGHAFSAVQRFADDAIAACPSCGKPPRRLLSNPALVFKGSGWYKTDSRGPDKRDTRDKIATADRGDAVVAAGPEKNTEKGTEKGTEKKDRADVPAASGAGRSARDGAGRSEGAAPGAPATTPAKTPAKTPEKVTPASS